MILIKRVYLKPEKTDGIRILVDRLWPRGLTKEKAKIDLWIKDIAPSHELRNWYSHDPDKWHEFKKRYFKELKKKEELVQSVLNHASEKTTTLLFSTKEEEFNNAVALKEYLDKNRREP
jgi:uncharacterized protein YeaO (DUF488 family)